MAADKIIVARLNKAGSHFEVSVDPDKAVEFKQGFLDTLATVLQSDDIFSDTKKGLLCSDEQLLAAFETTDHQEIAAQIIRQGEIQLSAEHRAKLREQRKKQLIEMIRIQAVDPKTKLPHPATRIEAALEEARIHLVDHKRVEEQFEETIKKLRPILPLSIEMAIFEITMPAEQLGKGGNFVRKNSKILKEEWTSQGHWKIKIEIPAGFSSEFVNSLNSCTHAKCIIQRI